MTRSCPIETGKSSQDLRRLLVLASCRQFAPVRSRPVFIRHRDPSPSLEVHTDHVLHSIFSVRGDQRPEVIPL